MKTIIHIEKDIKNPADLGKVSEGVFEVLTQAGVRNGIPLEASIRIVLAALILFMKSRMVKFTRKKALEEIKQAMDLTDMIEKESKRLEKEDKDNGKGLLDT